MSKNQETYKYIQDSVNIYFRPMLDDLVNEMPNNV